MEKSIISKYIESKGYSVRRIEETILTKFIKKVQDGIINEFKVDNLLWHLKKKFINC